MARYQSLICEDIERRQQIVQHSLLNGIDYIEVVTEPGADNQRVLQIYFIEKSTVAGQNNLSLMLNALNGDVDKFTLSGGVRIPNIKVESVQRVTDHLELRVSEPGDYFTYTLSIDYIWGPEDGSTPKLDPVYAECDFSFKAGCPSDFDCRPVAICPTEIGSTPLIDYMAKDYASFRQALLDLIPTLAPHWLERSPADLSITLVELLAYVGDQLSYYQDSVANEATLETARQRISVRRHARLIDYRMHDGASARTFVHVGVDSPGEIPAATPILSQISKPLGSKMPGTVIAASLQDQAQATTEAVFETMTAVKTHQDLNDITLYAWGNRQCCLPRGATTVDLKKDLTAHLKVGDFLLIEEIKGPETGLSADADPTHRQVVRLTAVTHISDPLTGQDLTTVKWDMADALKFPLCLSARTTADKQYIARVSVARGNLVLADHGQTIRGEEQPLPEAPPNERQRRAHRFLLNEGPLSFRVPAPKDNGTLAPTTRLMATDPRLALPQIVKLQVPGDAINRWQPVPHLLDSDDFDAHFAVETDNNGRCLIRFGDGEYGAAPADSTDGNEAIKVDYRVGVGRAGNVGAEALIHLIEPDTAANWPDVIKVRNPLPAWGGTDPEPIEEVKLLAPAAFQSEQKRAVTEEDYALAAELHPQIAKAVATFRWTGSWHTVFITIDPFGRSEVSDALQTRVRDWVIGFTQAGYDLEIDPPIYVPLEIEIDICVVPTHFRADVEQAALTALSNKVLSNDRLGFFHPDNFTFGQSLYLSQLYAAIEAVEGVDSATVQLFKRFYKLPDKELEKGAIPIGRLEVVQLDNDPNFPENGVLRLNMLGGK